MLEGYKCKPFTSKLNKKKLPINLFNFDKVDKFNEIYQYVKANYRLGKMTPSQGISIDKDQCRHERYIMIKGNQRYELVVATVEGCYRFILKNKKSEKNTVTGIQAAREIYKQANHFKIDFNKYTVENGADIKKEIKSPHIEVLAPKLLDTVLDNVYHIDFNSSYASRICETYPELLEMYQSIYDRRKMNNDYFKHVLTNSIGCFQSEYCPDPTDSRRAKPYILANLSKIAVNGTRELVEYYIDKLFNKGFIPLLSNTDGIWYYSPDGKSFRDSHEGTALLQWKHDHKKCKFLMVSSGCYQYEENGIVKSVVRGICNLDAEVPDREKWKLGDILNIKDYFTYTFDEEKGVIKTYE